MIQADIGIMHTNTPAAPHQQQPQPIHNFVQEVSHEVQNSITATGNVQTHLVFEKDRKCAKILVVLALGDPSSVEVGDNMTTIQYVENPGVNIDFVVTVGFSVQEAASALISRAEKNIQLMAAKNTSLLSSGPTHSIPSPLVTASAVVVDAASTIKPEEEVRSNIIQGFYAICSSCGFRGNNLVKCERCRRVFPDPPKPMPCKNSIPLLATGTSGLNSGNKTKNSRKKRNRQRKRIFMAKMRTYQRRFSQTTAGTTYPNIFQPQALSSTQRTSHNNYEIHTLQILKNRNQEVQNCSKNHGNSAKMLVILASEERRVITFTLPPETCRLQDLLEQVDVPFDNKTTIQCVTVSAANIIDFDVSVGFSVQESTNAKQSFQLSRNLGRLPTILTSSDAAQQSAAVTNYSSSLATPLMAAKDSSLLISTANIHSATTSPSFTAVIDDASSTTNKPAEEVQRKNTQGVYAVCWSCGFRGYNHAKCDRCNQVFLVPPKRKKKRLGQKKRFLLLTEKLNRGKADLKFSNASTASFKEGVHRGVCKTAKAEPVLSKAQSCDNKSATKDSASVFTPSGMEYKHTAVPPTARVAPYQTGFSQTITTESEPLALSSVQVTPHNNYEIHTNHVLQNRRQTVKNYSERDNDSAKMLIVLASGQQRLLTFALPRESCTVHDLLEQVGVPFDSKTTIQCIENPGGNIDFVVNVGFSMQESASELIARAEESIQMMRNLDRLPTILTSSDAAQQSAAVSNCSSSLGTPLLAAKDCSLLISTANIHSSTTSPSCTAVIDDASSTTTKSAEEFPRKTIPGFYAVCSSCGFKGYNHSKCDRCKRVFVQPPKRIECINTIPLFGTGTSGLNNKINNNKKTRLGKKKRSLLSSEKKN